MSLSVFSKWITVSCIGFCSLFRCETKALIPPSKKNVSFLSVFSSERLIVRPEFKKDSSLSLFASISKLYFVLVNVFELGLKLIVVPFFSDLGPFLSAPFGLPCV